MKIHPVITIVFCLVINISLATISMAQVNTNHNQADTSNATILMTNGVVKKIDFNSGKITIKHEAIKHLDMPSMTMVFTIKEKSLLKNIKPNDNIQFIAINENGKIVITALSVIIPEQVPK